MSISTHQAKIVKQMFPDKWLEVLYVVASDNRPVTKGWKKISYEELVEHIDNYEAKTN